jgi:hypothetical protein
MCYMCVCVYRHVCIYIHVRCFTFFSFNWSLNSRLLACKAGLLLLAPHLQPFSCGYFGDRVMLFTQTSLAHDPCTLPAITGMTGMHHYAQLFSFEIESGKLFCSSCPGTVILLISASRIAWDERCEPLQLAIGWNRFLWTFCLGWLEPWSSQSQPLE